MSDSEIEKIRRDTERSKQRHEQFMNKAKQSLKAQREATDRQVEKMKEELDHAPRPLDTVSDSDALRAAVMNRADIKDAYQRTTIHKWDDGYS